MKKFWRSVKNKADKVSKIANGAPKNLPVKSPIFKKSPKPAILQGIILKILPSRAPGGTVQEIFQKAQKNARKSAEKVRQKAPPQIQSAIPEESSFFILIALVVVIAILPISPILLVIAGILFFVKLIFGD